METGEVKVHEKDQALFERIDETLAAYDADIQALPSYLRGYAEELDGLHSQVRSQRRR